MGKAIDVGHYLAVSHVHVYVLLFSFHFIHLTFDVELFFLNAVFIWKSYLFPNNNISSRLRLGLSVGIELSSCSNTNQ